MTTPPPKNKPKSTKPSKNYQDKLNHLRKLDAEFGRELHARVKLAQEIYDDPEYREKIANMANIPTDAISPDALATAIDDTWPKLIALGYDLLGTHEHCTSLLAIFRAYPNEDDWTTTSLPTMAENITLEHKPEKATTTRRRATLKDLEERDEKIAKLEAENLRLELELSNAKQRLTELETENENLRRILADTPNAHVA